MVKTYSTKCRQFRENENCEVSYISNKRLFLSTTCALCGVNKNAFLKEDVTPK